MREPTEMREVRDQLVLAALRHVPFDGWTWRALREAAKDAGFDVTMAERAFPGGAVSAVEHFGELADRRLVEEAAESEIATMRVSERVAWLVRRRLEGWADHREAIRRAVTLLSLPTSGAAALRATWRTVDATWFAAGDVSADFSYYTKRATLAAVFGPTLLYWLEDSSDGFADSWSFLQRRLADVGRLPVLGGAVRRQLDKLPNPLHWLIGQGASRRHFGVRRA